MFNHVNFGDAFAGNNGEGPNPNFVQKNIEGFDMTLDPSDGGISHVLYHVGVRERAFMSLLHSIVSPGMVCWDLGCNIGYTTLFMLRNVGPDGFVYAVDPDPRNLTLANINFNSNNFNERVEVTQCAISDHTGKLDFWMADKPNLNSVSQTKHSTDKVTVDCFSVPDFLENRKYPNFIKMDVEGHEVKIFESGLDYFSKNDGTTHFLVEVHPHLYSKENDFEAVLAEYFKLGFRPTFVVSTPVPQPQLFKESGYEPIASIPTDGFVRGVYNNISNEDLLKFACRENMEGDSKKIVRSFMLSRGV
tara:strand:- start:984 stop:1895 length:912 start_codon:yes stop_codon:yes gene_type:complete